MYTLTLPSHYTPKSNKSQRRISQLIIRLKSKAEDKLPLNLTRTTIEELVINALPFELSDRCNWHNVLLQTLERIKRDTAKTPCRYTASISHSPLFETQGSLDQHKTHIYFSEMLNELKASTH